MVRGRGMDTSTGTDSDARNAPTRAVSSSIPKPKTDEKQVNNILCKLFKVMQSGLPIKIPYDFDQTTRNFYNRGHYYTSIELLGGYTRGYSYPTY